MKAIVLTIIGIFLIGLVSAQVEFDGSKALANEKKEIKIESSKDKIKSMISSFDVAIERGVISVSFKNGTSEKEAEEILKRHGLSFAKNGICFGSGDLTAKIPLITVGSNGSTTNVENKAGSNIKADCVEKNAWNKELSTGTVEVPKNKEKIFAELLVTTEEKIVWVEPIYKQSYEEVNSEDVALKVLKEHINSSPLNKLLKAIKGFFKTIF